MTSDRTHYVGDDCPGGHAGDTAGKAQGTPQVPTVLNPEAIGDPDQNPVVQLPAKWSAPLSNDPDGAHNRALDDAIRRLADLVATDEHGRLDRILATAATEPAPPVDDLPDAIYDVLNDSHTDQQAGARWDCAFQAWPAAQAVMTVVGPEIERLRGMVAALEAENALLVQALDGAAHRFEPMLNYPIRCVECRAREDAPQHRTPARVRAQLDQP